MKTLIPSTSNFDRVNSFVVKFDGSSGSNVASLRKSHHTGMFWALKRNTRLKDIYTEDDRAESARLNASEPICDGEIVEIEGNKYKVRVLGNFTDCAVFDNFNDCAVFDAIQ